MTKASRPEIAITYRRSGGLAGIDLVADLRSDELDDADAAAVQKLLNRPPAAKTAANPRRSDQFDHRLTLSDGATQRDFHWSEGEVPDEARSLLTALGRRAEPTRS